MTKRKTLLTFTVLALVAFSFPPKDKIKIWLIGDSTMSVKDKKAFPETGWGMPFVNFWDSTVVINNRAKNGRSSKSFFAENLWTPVMANMQAGDYVFIQFGHNDESKDKGERYSSPEEFKANLEKYISETRSAKAIPVLITPVARKKFDSSGNIKPSHGVYADVVRAVAKVDNIILIDLEKKSMSLLQQLGPKASEYLFNYLEPGEHPNYPEGKKDDTHFNELGAGKMAEIILAEIKIQIPELAKRIVIPR